MEPAVGVPRSLGRRPPSRHQAGVHPIKLWEGTAVYRPIYGEERISRDALGGRVIHVTATGLIAREGRVLLGKRTSTIRFAGMWDAFGGHLGPCEEASTTFVRELEEELGITALRPRFLGIYEDLDPTSKELFRHSPFFVTRWNGEPRIPTDSTPKIRWIPPDEADGLCLAPSLKDAIRRVLPQKP